MTNPREDNPQGWHLDRTISVSVIAMIAAQFVGGLWVLAEMRRDIDVLKTQMQTQIAVQTQRDDRQDREAHDTRTTLQTSLERIDAKLDRLIEGRARK